MKQTRDARTFFQYVIPSVLSFALSGVCTIADGFFVGNSIGDLGLSAVTQPALRREELFPARSGGMVNSNVLHMTKAISQRE